MKIEHSEENKDENMSLATESSETMPKFTRGSLVISCEFCDQILSYKKYKQHLQICFPEKRKKSVDKIKGSEKNLLIQCKSCPDRVPYDQYLDHVNLKHKEPFSFMKRMKTIEIEIELPNEKSELMRIPFIENSQDEFKTCGFCFDEYKDGEKLIYLPCMHRFHENCLDKLLNKKSLCPICQQQIFKQ